MDINTDEIAGLMTHGGGTLIFIAIASVLALTLAIERLITMRKILPEAQALFADLQKHLLRGDVDLAVRAAEKSKAMAADIFNAAFSRWRGTQGRDFEGTADRERMALLLVLKKRLWAIGTIGTIAPFAGLFGTVVGIMGSFSSMAESGTGGFAVVAAGISHALIATASGIGVAIEAVVFYNFFQAKLGNIAAELKLMTEEFCELLADISIPEQSSGTDHNSGKSEEPASSTANAAAASAVGQVSESQKVSMEGG